MTYTFKLARRLAVSRRLCVLPALALIAACSSTDTTSPEASLASLPSSGIYGWRPRESTPVSVRINPSTVTVETNQLIQFRARGRNRAGDDIAAPVTWSTTGGTILPDGRFSAAAVGTYQVVGSSRTRGDAVLVDSAMVTVVRRPIGVVEISVTPKAASLTPGVSQRFSAIGRLRNDSPVPVGVHWTASGGTIDAGGTYVAGDTAGTYRVVATNLAGTLADSATVTIGAPPSLPPPSDTTQTPPPPTIPMQPPAPQPPGTQPTPPPPPPAPTLAKVTLVPSTATLVASTTKQFGAYGINSAGDSVAVSVSYVATGGTVSSNGLYTAGRTAGSFRIIATSEGKADTSSITITNAAASGTGSFSFGAWDLRPADYASPFNSSVTSLSPDYAWDLLDGLQAKGAKVFVNFAGGSFSNVQNPDGTFSYDRWKARVDRFLPYKARIQSYIDAGTIVGFMMVDEPHSTPSWGGQAVSYSTIEQMAKYTKSIWPNLLTTVRANASWLDGATFRWAYLDAAWAQYSVRKGSVSNFTTGEVAAAKAAGLGLITGLNIISGGDGSSGVAGPYAGAWNMSPTEVRNYGKVLINDPYVCSFQSWKYTTAYMSQSSIITALTEVADLGHSIKHEGCRVR